MKTGNPLLAPKLLFGNAYLAPYTASRNGLSRESVPTRSLGTRVKARTRARICQVSIINFQFLLVDSLADSGLGQSHMVVKVEEVAGADDDAQRLHFLDVQAQRINTLGGHFLVAQLDLPQAAG